jgi:hypothetical protein
VTSSQITRSVITVLLFFLFFKPYAQIAKLEFGSNYKKEEPASVDFISNTDNSIVAIVSQFTNKCKVHIVDKDFKTIVSFDMPVKEKSIYQGGLFMNDTLRFYFFTYTYKETTLTTCSYLLAQMKLTEKNTAVDLFDENILNLIVKEEKLIVFTLKNSRQAFGTYTYVNGERRNINTYNFTGKIPGKAKAVDEIGILGQGRPGLVKKRFEPEFGDVINRQIKTYVNYDSMHVIVNYNTGETVVYNMSVKNNGCSYRKIYHAQPEFNETGKKLLSEDNSYLCGNKLFYFITYPDSLMLMIYDFKTGQKINTFKKYKNDTVLFKNTTLLKNGKIATRGLLEKAADKPSDQFKLLRSGQPLVYAEETENGIEVMIGSYKIMVADGTAYYSSGVPSVTVSTPYGTAVTGGVSGRWMGGGYGEEFTEHIEFITVLNKESLSHNDAIQNPTSSLRQRKVQFAGQLFKKPLELMYVKLGGKECLVYFNKKRNMYEVFDINEEVKK